jgi:hypothetical protein
VTCITELAVRLAEGLRDGDTLAEGTPRYLMHIARHVAAVWVPVTRYGVATLATASAVAA